MRDQQERADRFATLHGGAGAFIIPNPWDAGSARLSVGGAHARSTLGALLYAALEIREQGSFGWTSAPASLADVTRLLGGPDD